MIQPRKFALAISSEIRISLYGSVRCVVRNVQPSSDYSSVSPALSISATDLTENKSQYSLRNSNNILSVHANSTLYFNSFLPSVIAGPRSLVDKRVDS